MSEEKPNPPASPAAGPSRLEPVAVAHRPPPATRPWATRVATAPGAAATPSPAVGHSAAAGGGPGAAGHPQPLRARPEDPRRREAHDAVAEPGARGASSGGVPVGYVEQRSDEPARRRQAACAAAGRDFPDGLSSADAAIAAGLAHQGSLANESALHLFAAAAASRANGRLTIAPEGRSYVLTFRRGVVEHVASSDAEDELGRFLVRKATLSADALGRAEASRGAFGGDLASALIAERAVNPADVAALLQEHGSAVAIRALGAEAGAWSWNPQAPPPPGAFPLGQPFAMLCAAARALDAAALMRRLGTREHRSTSRAGARVRIEELRLTPQETRAAGLFDGVRTPAEIAAANPAEALTVLRLAVLLGDVGLLSFAPPGNGARAMAAPPAQKAATGPAQPRAPTPARPGASDAGPPAACDRPATAAPPPRPAAASQSARRPAPPSRVVASADPSPNPSPRGAWRGEGPARAGSTSASPAPRPAPLDRAALEALRDKLATADHFAVLGVKQDASAAQIKAAYFQLAKAYHPDTVPAEAPPEVKSLCAELFAKVSESWSVVGNDASRAAYLRDLKGSGTVDVDVMNILQAENVFQAGTVLVKVRKYAEALARFEEATKLNPDEPEFAMWKAWCEFLLAQDKKKTLAPASAAIDAALKRNPRCAQGYLFLGQMAKIAGDAALAEKQLRRGLQAAPGNGELQRELKYLRR